MDPKLVRLGPVEIDPAILTGPGEELDALLEPFGSPPVPTHAEEVVVFE